LTKPEDVIIIEDIVDSGNTLDFFIKTLEKLITLLLILMMNSSSDTALIMTNSLETCRGYMSFWIEQKLN